MCVKSMFKYLSELELKNIEFLLHFKLLGQFQFYLPSNFLFILAQILPLFMSMWYFCK